MKEEFRVHVVLTGVLVFAVAVFMTMVGKGGSFLVPLVVLACGVPMHVAVGTT